MNELQAKNYINRIAQSGKHESGLTIRILHIVKDDPIKAAEILQAVEIYVEHFKRPISYKATRQNHKANNNNHNPARKLKQTVSNPGKALDRYLAKQKKAAVKKTKVWARDNIARPVVAVALRIVGMEMKK